MNWHWYSFSQLSTTQLYQVLRLRSEIFVVEQQCPYQDLDNKDLSAYHLLGYQEDNLVAYLRWLPKGVSYPEHASIGRVTCAPAFRRQGIGRQLMQQALLFHQQNGVDPLKISAQAHLERFYQSLGFSTVSERYLEDNIPHLAMTCDDVTAKTPDFTGT